MSAAKSSATSARMSYTVAAVPLLLLLLLDVAAVPPLVLLLDVAAAPPLVLLLLLLDVAAAPPLLLLLAPWHVAHAAMHFVCTKCTTLTPKAVG
jgi:hypothetical protein